MRESHVTGRASLSSKPFLALCLVLVVGLLTGCKGEFSGSKDEFVYVAVPEAVLRDHVATIYSKTGMVHNGDKLQVLDRTQNRRFLRVRAPHGEEGWLQERYVADQQTYDQFQRIADQYKDTPAQATATIMQQVKVHIQPGKKTGYLYLLDEKQKVAMLERRRIDRNAAPAPPKDQDSESDTSDEDAPGTAAPSIWDDWWLIRDSQQHVGWVLGRALYLDLPDEVAQYAEGQRIVAAFPLDEVEDQGKKVQEFLVLFTEPKDGMPYDFDQIRVYTWNNRKHRYETAYRERNLDGSLPVTLGRQDFEKEGNLRTFILRLKDANGQPHEQLYKFKPPLVHKVYAPGEEPKPGPRRKPISRAKKHENPG
ncbi:MAG TPA: SH3 domain-containing protein [Terriglobales bacterium]